MPLSTSIVGDRISPLTHSVDARWLMAYAAGLGDGNPRYMDTSAHTVIAHPVFPVCVEWPVILNIREIAGTRALTAAEAQRGVHAAHDLHIYKPIKAGDQLSTDATMIDVRSIRPGAAYVMRLDTTDAAGELVTRTYQTGIYRGVEVETADAMTGAAEVPPPLPERIDPLGHYTTDLSVGAAAAHIYTECARIFNPIHTDRAIALSAGLPDIILHGTATLAMAVSAIVDEFADGDPTLVRRLGGRFAAMVLMPSTIRLHAVREGDTVSYEVRTQEDQTAISQGFVCLGLP